MPAGMLGRQLTTTTVGELCGIREYFIKPADAKIASLPASMAWPEEFARKARSLGLPGSFSASMSDPVTFVAEYRCFSLGGQVVASSAYLIDGKAWDAWDPSDLPDTSEAAWFASVVAESIAPSMPEGWVLDVGRFDSSQWAVVETNSAWSSNPYCATEGGAEGGAEGVVVTILAAQGDDEDGRFTWQGPELRRMPVPLPRRGVVQP